MQIIPEHVTRVQGHNVKYSNRSDSAADCSISLKFGTKFYHVTGDTSQMFKVRGQRSKVKVTGSKVKVTAKSNLSTAKTL